MTPALIGLVGTVVIAFCLWVVEHALTKSKTPEALPQSNDEPLACDALIARTFEQRMVDAGIMTVEEMTVCENYLCADCKPSRKPRQAVYTAKERLPKYAKHGEQRLRYKMLGGGEQDLPWPESIPTHAHVRFDYDKYGSCARAMFTWTDEATGQTLSKTMLVPDFGFEAKPFPLETKKNGSDHRPKRINPGYS